MGKGSVKTMEVLGLLFTVALASAVGVQEVAVQEIAVQQSVLDVYTSSSQRPTFNGVDLYQGPVIVLANTSGQQDNGLVAYYADNGIRSIVDSRKFQPLHQLLRAFPNVSGLVIGNQDGDNSFLVNVVRDFVLPDNFKLYDLVRENEYTVPIVYVAPKGVFNNHSFVALEHVARFVVGDFNIDQVPVNKSSQSTSHHPVKVPVVLVPVFTQGYPHHYSQSPGFNPFYNEHSGSFPFKYQSPVFYPYSYNSFNNRGTNSFPFFGLEAGFNPVGYNYQFPNKYPYSFYYTRYPSRF